MKWQHELRLAADAARAAGDLLLSAFRDDAAIEKQQGKDIKTRADREAESVIVSRLEASGFPVLGEEAARSGADAPGLRWLVDPLDGTMNFTRGFPMHAVSVALWEGMTPVLGAILDLSRNSMYTGCIGAGAWRNDWPIHVSATAERGQAILATGFPTARDYGDESLRTFVSRVQGFKKVRMIGSAAMSLGLVAEGVFDAYFEEDIMLWDVAAGLAIVAAAGGHVELCGGHRRHSVIASGTNGRVSL